VRARITVTAASVAMRKNDLFVCIVLYILRFVKKLSKSMSISLHSFT
jgi:hypothetical protein